MYIAAGWMNITMQKYVTEIIMTKKRPLGVGRDEGAGVIFSSNCRPHTSFLKTTNLLLHQVGEVVTLQEANEVVIFFLLWIEIASWSFNPLSNKTF